MGFFYIVIGLGLACWALLVVAGMAVTTRKERIFVADCVGTGGFVAGIIGVLLKLFTVPLQNMVRIPESLTIWMCVILILSSTVIMMLSKIYEVLVTLFNKDDRIYYRHITQQIAQQLIEINGKDDSQELRHISQQLTDIKRKDYS